MFFQEKNDTFASTHREGSTKSEHEISSEIKASMSLKPKKTGVSFESSEVVKCNRQSVFWPCGAK